MTTTKKKCATCGKTKPLSEFYVHRDHGDGLTSSCKDCTKKYNKQHYYEAIRDNPAVMEKRRKRAKFFYDEHREHTNAKHRQNHRLIREKVIAAYGGCCECCGETRYEFLSIDHINGGGGAQRREYPGFKIDRWLIKNNFPNGFRVLCHNCNQALGHYGYCPHQAKSVKHED